MQMRLCAGVSFTRASFTRASPLRSAALRSALHSAVARGAAQSDGDSGKSLSGVRHHEGYNPRLSHCHTVFLRADIRHVVSPPP